MFIKSHYSKIITTAPTVCPEVQRTICELYRAHEYNLNASTKIECIKSIRSIWGLGLKEAKELVEVAYEGRPIEDTCLGDPWELD